MDDDRLKGECRRSHLGWVVQKLKSLGKSLYEKRQYVEGYMKCNSLSCYIKVKIKLKRPSHVTHNGLS